MGYEDVNAVRTFPIGAELVEPGLAAFRVWAPQRSRITAVIERAGTRARCPLQAEGNGYFSGARTDVAPGTRYRYQLDDDGRLYPDPMSRYQPEGHDGPSELIDPRAYAWSDDAWRGVKLEGQVIYEMHIGTFTREGTWRAAAQELDWLAKLGITVLEIMPVGEFPGRYGWGYDVVHFYAPTRLYGTPDDMRAFVDTAHRLGMGVILDVIYNHCATTGSYLDAFAAEYFSHRHKNDWGHAINYDGPGSGPVREFFVTNAEYWIREYHLDGYRLDATQTIFDETPRHILAEITGRARAAAGGRDVLVIAENEPQHIRLTLAPEAGGCGLDALWNDDFHHTARVAATGRREAYYTDYRGTPQELVAAAKWGFLYQGQFYGWQKKRRGMPALKAQPAQFVNYLQNHDQVANSTRGLRLHQLTTPGRYRALTALLLLAPGTPLIFQGQEFAASSPFLYFADNDNGLARIVSDGRKDFLRQFPSVAAGGDALLADPAAADTLERSRLDLAERDRHAEIVALHRDLLRLRRTDAVFSAQRARGIDGAVLNDEAFVLRYFDDDGEDRLLIVNLGREAELAPLPEPLLAPPQGARWTLVFSTEDVRYGGDGTPFPVREPAWHLPAHAALVLAPAMESDGRNHD